LNSVLLAAREIVDRQGFRNSLTSEVLYRQSPPRKMPS